jgi:hypothetical protein
MKTWKVVTVSDLQTVPIRKTVAMGTLDHCIRTGEQRAQKYQGSSYIYLVGPEINELRFIVQDNGNLYACFNKINNFSFNGRACRTGEEFREITRWATS